MYLRDFQFVLRRHNHELYKQARDIWQPLELRIRSAIPQRCRFGDVGKIVLELGPEKEKKAKYRVLLGVGLYHFEAFDVHAFLTINRSDAIAQLGDVTEKSMRDLCVRFSTEADWLFSLLESAKKEPNQTSEPTSGLRPAAAHL